MKDNKISVIKWLVCSVAITCGMIIYINLSLKAYVYEPRRPITLASVGPKYDDWVDNFDSSYIEPVTGCLYLTHKKK